MGPSSRANGCKVRVGLSPDGLVLCVASTTRGSFGPGVRVWALGGAKKEGSLSHAAPNGTSSTADVGPTRPLPTPPNELLRSAPSPPPPRKRTASGPPDNEHLRHPPTMRGYAGSSSYGVHGGAGGSQLPSPGGRSPSPDGGSLLPSLDAGAGLSSMGAGDGGTSSAAVSGDSAEPDKKPHPKLVKGTLSHALAQESNDEAAGLEALLASLDYTGRKKDVTSQIAHPALSKARQLLEKDSESKNRLLRRLHEMESIQPLQPGEVLDVPDDD